MTLRPSSLPSIKFGSRAGPQVWGERKENFHQWVLKEKVPLWLAFFSSIAVQIKHSFKVLKILITDISLAISKSHLPRGAPEVQSLLASFRGEELYWEPRDGIGDRPSLTLFTFIIDSLGIDTEQVFLCRSFGHLREVLFFVTWIYDTGLCDYQAVWIWMKSCVE